MLKISDNPPARWPLDRSITTDLGAWSVARVKPRNEKAFARELQKMDLGYYLPLLTKRTIRKDNGKPRKSIVCLFPGYVPIVDYAEHRGQILRGGRVLTVIEVVDQKKFVDELEHIHRAAEHGQLLDSLPGLALGRRVVITAGPMRGVEGVVTDLDRPQTIHLNVEMFNRSVTVSVSPEELKMIED